jgi:hypothetical protein
MSDAVLFIRRYSIGAFIIHFVNIQTLVVFVLFEGLFCCDRFI